MAEQTYPVSEAASQLGIREDDLSALLPDIGHVSGQPLTQNDVQRVARLIDRIRAMHREEGPYSPS